MVQPGGVSECTVIVSVSRLVSAGSGVGDRSRGVLIDRGRRLYSG